MSYNETLAYLYERLPMFQRIGKAAYKADLSNTHALMDVLGHPERGLTCIHLAGTNGKGSTANMLASVLQEAGYRTGLHTSPHLKDFRERFRINGEMVPEETVTRTSTSRHSGASCGARWIASIVNCDTVTGRATRATSSPARTRA